MGYHYYHSRSNHLDSGTRHCNDNDAAITMQAVKQALSCSHFSILLVTYSVCALENPVEIHVLEQLAKQ